MALASSPINQLSHDLFEIQGTIPPLIDHASLREAIVFKVEGIMQMIPSEASESYFRSFSFNQIEDVRSYGIDWNGTDDQSICLEKDFVKGLQARRNGKRNIYDDLEACEELKMALAVYEARALESIFKHPENFQISQFRNALVAVITLQRH